MTTHQYKRCSHCGVEYLFQGSGASPPVYNDSRWCPSCTEVAYTALRTVPRRFECRYRDIREMPEQFATVTIETLRDWEQQQLAKFPMQRIWPGLINIETGASQDIREIRSPAGKAFRVSEWRGGGENTEPPLIEVPMEYDLSEQRFTGASWPH